MASERCALHPLAVWVASIFDQEDAEPQYEEDEPQNDAWQAVFDNGEQMQKVTWATLCHARSRMALLVGGLGRGFGERMGPFSLVERRCPWERRVGVSSSSLVFLFVPRCLLLRGLGFARSAWPVFAGPRCLVQNLEGGI